MVKTPSTKPCGPLESQKKNLQASLGSLDHGSWGPKGVALWRRTDVNNYVALPRQSEEVMEPQEPDEPLFGRIVSDNVLLRQPGLTLQHCYFELEGSIPCRKTYHCYSLPPHSLRDVSQNLFLKCSGLCITLRKQRDQTIEATNVIAGKLSSQSNPHSPTKRLNSNP